MGFTWTVAPTDVFPQMAEKYTQAVFGTARSLAQQKAAEMEAWAKANAPWQDRTGAARAGLTAVANGTTITLSHGVDYGIWLEVANSGRYAIIAQAVDMFGASYMDELQRMLAGGGLAGFTFAGDAARFRNLATGRFVSRAEIEARTR